MTYSIVAHDANEGEWGVAVASKFLAVGSLVSWAQAGAGAVATQAFVRVSFGPDGLAMLAQGHSAQITLETLLRDDPGVAARQVGLVDAHGGVAAHTGQDCHDWAGHRMGDGFACQGNILTGPEPLDAMMEAFSEAKGELADRLVAALIAGDDAGGDRRGKQSAAVLVVKPNGSYGGDTDRYLDLRVDDDPQPVQRLQGLVATHHLFFGTPRPEDQLSIDESLARELQHMLLTQRYSNSEVTGVWDTDSKRAFWQLIGNENLEERWNLNTNPDQIDKVALDYLRELFKQ